MDFSGYDGHGKAELNQKSRLETYKKIAKIEGNKAKVDSKTMDAIIDNAQSVDDLSTQASSATNGSNADSINLQNYVRHFTNTHLYWSQKNNLLNGQKITLSVRDNSDQPFISEQKQSIKVQGLKKTRKVSVQDFKDNIKVEATGTNHFGKVDMKFVDHTNPRIEIPYENDANYIFGMDNTHTSDPDKAYSNGDKISISGSEFAEVLNDMTDKYYFTSKPKEKVTYTVSGLKNRNTTIKNI